MAGVKSAFEAFGVNAAVSEADLRKAFHRLVVRVHPDKGGDETGFQDLMTAYKTLLDSSSRKAHLEATRPFAAGKVVRVVGLHNKSELNGCLGGAGAWDGLRLLVCVGGSTFAVKPANLQEAGPRAAWAQATGAGAWASSSHGEEGPQAWAGAARGSASAGTALVFCPGNEDGGCPNWAQVTSSRGKCKTCRNTEVHSPQVPPPPQNSTEQGWTDKTHYLEAARTVNFLLAKCPPPALVREGGSFSTLLWRLCVAADTDIVAGEVRKLASHCGGVPPSSQLPGFTDTPMVADPTNSVYAAVVARLIRSVAEQEPEAYASMPPWGVQMLRQMCHEKLGDVCEAVLAAANAAADEEQGRPHRWETLHGGAAPVGDASVPLLVRLVSWQTH